MNRKTIWLYIFFTAAFVNLYANIFPNQLLSYISKPLLMIALGFHFWSNRKQNSYTNLILLGLFFAFLGDTFLMLRFGETNQELFFLLGLGSFLITQLCYFLAFWKYAGSNGFLKKQPWVVLPFLIYFVWNTYNLWYDMPTAFRLPVMVYSGVITMMAVSCFNLYKAIPQIPFQYLLIGVLLFVISDSLIGISQFKKAAIPYTGFLIMSTYIAAQYLIVKGSLLLEGKE